MYICMRLNKRLRSKYVFDWHANQPWIVHYVPLWVGGYTIYAIRIYRNNVCAKFIRKAFAWAHRYNESRVRIYLWPISFPVYHFMPYHVAQLHNINVLNAKHWQLVDNNDTRTSRTHARHRNLEANTWRKCETKHAWHAQNIVDILLFHMMMITKRPWRWWCDVVQMAYGFLSSTYVRILFIILLYAKIELRLFAVYEFFISTIDSIIHMTAKWSVYKHSRGYRFDHKQMKWTSMPIDII